MKKNATLRLICGYAAMAVGVASWFRYMDSPTRNPDVAALLLWLSAFVVSAALTLVAFRNGNGWHKVLACPLFVLHVVAVTFYMALLQGTGRQ